MSFGVSPVNYSDSDSDKTFPEPWANVYFGKNATRKRDFSNSEFKSTALLTSIILVLSFLFFLFFFFFNNFWQF